MFEKDLNDENFQSWSATLSKEPEQVIRYNRSDSSILTPDGNDIDYDFGKCPYCDEARSFEFQTTPHLFLKTGYEVNDDIATILIATCRIDCKTKGSFAYEKSIPILYK